MNNLGSQWRTLQPHSPSELSLLTTNTGAFQRPGSRQITKTPQNMFQNFPPTSQNSGSGMNFGNFGGFGNGMSGSGGGGLLSPGGLNSNSSRMSSGGNAFDFSSGNRGEQQQQQLSFGRTNPIGSYGGGSFSTTTSSSSSRMMGSNGFDSRPIASNGYGNSVSGASSSFERSISGNLFDPMMGGSTSNGFNRQMSMPTNLCDHAGSVSNGFGSSRANGSGTDGFRMFGGGSSSSRRDGSDGSPPSFGGGGPLADMKIGTWDDGNSSSASNRSNSAFPPVGNFEIGTFSVATTSASTTNRSSTSMEFSNGGGGAGASGGNVFNQASHNLQGGGLGIRETGIIEKLLHSYGFIQCCDRQARLFFHFSQFDGNIEHLKIGDPVEFEMTYDRRTGKPIASMVSKIAPEVVMSEERVIGTVTTEIKIDSETGQETQGRISYENRGECFFLPFTMPDVEGNVTLASGDRVSFQMATMQRSGTLVARAIRLENPAKPVKYQGVVNSIKEQGKFGFIERSDVVREIFFHFTEVEEGNNVDLGDDVEFTIQTRNGKEVACTITKLPSGTVVFEDVGSEFFRGQVLKPIDRATKYATDGDALNGRIKYRAEDRSEVEVPFGEKDQIGDFTLKHGDWVKFVIATDRRDKLQRATKIELLEESFQVSDERREQGTVQAVKEGFGFIRCADRDVRMFFHFSEWLDVKRPQEVGDECEFTVAPDCNQPGRLLATRIKRIQPGTVKFEILIQADVTGRVEVEPSSSAWPRSPSKTSTSNGKSSEGEESSPNAMPGKILYELNGMSLEIPLFANDCDLRNFPRKDDLVIFDINQVKATKETKAVNIRLVEQQKGAVSGDKEKPKLGFVAALKDGFGFIETLSHEKEIFFHFSNFDGKAEKLEVGTEVEYCVFNREKGGKISAEGVKIVSKGTIPPLPAKDEFFNGKVIRPLRSVNPDQDEYCGLIQTKSEEGVVLGEYKFGIASLTNKKELLQVGDPVQFQVHQNDKFAVNIQATREKLRAFVEAVKGQFGFLSHEVDEGKKLFFHMSEVEGGEILQQGDEVEFVVVTNKRTGKHSACCVRKLSSSKRPERLISKLKTMNLEDAARGGKKMIVARQPKGPDGSKGFKAVRKVA